MRNDTKTTQTCEDYVMETMSNNSPADFSGWIVQGGLSVNIIIEWLFEQVEYDETTNTIKDIINGETKIIDPENMDVIY